ncbi:MAG: hypothetical protein V4505_25230 [Pseudomonadota bacterium]
MGFFSSKPKVTSYDLGAFIRLMQNETDSVQYKAKAGSALTQALLASVFDEQVRRCKAPDGLWAGVGSPADRTMTVAANAVLKCKAPNDEAKLKKDCGMVIGGDLMKVKDRESYVMRMLAQAKNAELSAAMADGKTRPEAEYYTPPVFVAGPGAPPIPPWPAKWIARDAAIGWLTQGLHSGAERFRSVIEENLKPGFPLGSNPAFVNQLWNLLVGYDASVPRSRAPSIQPVPYPSSMGGTYLLKRIFEMTAGEVWPAQGDAAWYDWALFFFGAMMTVQGFPDGNKRVCRTVYALILLCGGVPFKAPTDKYGAKLAGMMG